ncbi:MAG: GTP-binding protein [Candidatus Lokiarchaeota archaeon]|nr:GTP-binding protein [Candidatus Lokiarchaeota archaeon]
MNYKLKVLLCGSPYGEKTKLVNRFVQSKFNHNYKTNVGVDIFTKNVELKNNKSCTLSIWDIGSSSRFRFMRSTFYRGASCAILVFDLTKDTTWDEVKEWCNEITKYVGKIPIAYVGNHMERIEGIYSEKRNKFRNLVESSGNMYFETSAMGEKIEDIFSTLVERTVGTFA